MGDVVNLKEYRSQRECDELQERLKKLAERMEYTQNYGYYGPLEDMLRDGQFSTEEEFEPTPEPEISTSRWDHFLKLIDALWLAFRHLWRVIWGPNYETYH